MKQLELLEAELKMIQENIERIKEYAADKDNKYNWKSRVVGEFKHRCFALKQRLTLASGIITEDLFKDEK